MPVTISWLQNNALYLLLALGTIFNIFWLFRFQDRLKMKWWAILIISVLHNMSIFGGVFLMPLAYFLGAKLFKRKPSEVFDIFTICMMFTLMCARINCIISGCCFGLMLPGLNGVRWPTRELEVAFYVVLLIVLGRKVLRGRTHGEIYPLYMAAYGAFRFVTEFFRYSEHSAGIFHLSHLWALIAFGLGVSIYYELQSKNKKTRR